MTDNEHKQEYIKRFSIFRILEHQAAVFSFTILVVTGLSQKFHDSSLAEWIIMNLGGIDNTRLIHRATGLVFATLTLLHIFVSQEEPIKRRVCRDASPFFFYISHSTELLLFKCL